jgi:hypothetical protein
MAYKAQVRSSNGWHTLATNLNSDAVRRKADEHSHKLAEQGKFDEDIRVIDLKGNVYMWWLWWPVFEVIGTVGEYEEHATHKHYDQIVDDLGLTKCCPSTCCAVSKYVREKHKEK